MNYSDCIALSALESRLHSVPRGVRYGSFPSSPCASAVSRALLGSASALERALVSLPTQLHSVLYQRTPFPALAPRHVADSSFYGSPEGTQLQRVLAVTRKNIYTHSPLRFALRVYGGAKMKMTWKKLSKDRKALQFVRICKWNTFYFYV